MTDWDYIWLLFYGYVVLMVLAMATWSLSEYRRMKAMRRQWKLFDEHIAGMLAAAEEKERAALNENKNG